MEDISVQDILCGRHFCSGKIVWKTFLCRQNCAEDISVQDILCGRHFCAGHPILCERHFGFCEIVSCTHFLCTRPSRYLLHRDPFSTFFLYREKRQWDTCHKNIIRKHAYTHLFLPSIKFIVNWIPIGNHLDSINANSGNNVESVGN